MTSPGGTIDQAIRLLIGYDDRSVAPGIEGTRRKLSELERDIGRTAKSWLGFGAALGAAATAMDAMRDAMVQTIRSGGGFGAFAMNLGDSVASWMSRVPIAGPLGEMGWRSRDLRSGGTGLTDAEQQAQRAEEVARTLALANAIEGLRRSLGAASMSPSERRRQAMDEQIGAVLRQLKESQDADRERVQARIDALRSSPPPLDPTNISSLRMSRARRDDQEALAANLEAGLESDRARFESLRAEFQRLQAEAEAFERRREEAPYREAVIEGERNVAKLRSQILEESSRRDGRIIEADTERIRREYQERIEVMVRSTDRMAASATDAATSTRLFSLSSEQADLLRTLRDLEIDRLSSSSAASTTPRAGAANEARFLSLRRDSPVSTRDAQERIDRTAREHLQVVRSVERTLGDIANIIRGGDRAVIGAIP